MKQKKVYSGIGGQAVISGIMMKNKKEYSIAIRLNDNSIKVIKENYNSLSEKYLICRLFFLRGIFALIDSLILGMKTLTYSANCFEDDTVEDQTKFEKWLYKTFGDKVFDIIMGIISFISVIIALFIFMVFPALISSLLKKVIESKLILSVVEGFIRIFIFVLYVKLISKLDDIRKTFEYHGSEHKCINCIENGLDLTVENVMKSSKEHKRCGTSFIVFVMIISIFLFMLMPSMNIWIKMLSRIILIPVIAGISYEILRLMGKFDNKLVDILSKPGMWMQGLTTKEPNEDQVEVAIKAVEEVFDWRDFKEKNFK